MKVSINRGELKQNQALFTFDNKKADRSPSSVLVQILRDAGIFSPSSGPNPTKEQKIPCRDSNRRNWVRETEVKGQQTQRQVENHLGGHTTYTVCKRERWKLGRRAAITFF
jgi:hypothetical protein